MCKAADIVPDAPLFGGGMGLDSIDALEIAVAIAQRYGVQLRAEDEATKRIFANCGALRSHIDAYRAPPGNLSPPNRSASRPAGSRANPP